MHGNAVERDGIRWSGHRLYVQNGPRWIGFKINYGRSAVYLL